MLEFPQARIINAGLRNKLDAQALRKHGGLIIGLECPAEVRFARRPLGDPKYPDDFEEFLAAERAEYDDPDEFGQHTEWVLSKQADYKLNTNRPVELVNSELDNIIVSELYK